MLVLRLTFLVFYVTCLFYIVVRTLFSFGIPIAHCFSNDESLNTRLKPQIIKFRKSTFIILILACVLFLIHYIAEYLNCKGYFPSFLQYCGLFISLAAVLSIAPLRKILFRISRGDISREFRLGDILVSDSLVSMASVLVDLGACFAGFLHYTDPWHPGPKLMALAMIPSIIRIRQCLIDFKRTQNRQHLFNTGKYLIGIMPHLIRVKMAYTEYVETHTALTIALAFNNLSSFLWDVFVDWKLAYFFDSSSKPLHRDFNFQRWMYISAVVGDFVMRNTFWYKPQTSWDAFGIQLTEITRRFMWMIFRVESEPIELDVVLKQ